MTVGSLSSTCVSLTDREASEALGEAPLAAAAVLGDSEVAGVCSRGGRCL